MPKLPVLTPKKLVKILIRLGFYIAHSVGSHQIFKHPDGRRTVVAMHNRTYPKVLYWPYWPICKLVRNI